MNLADERRYRLIKNITENRLFHGGKSIKQCKDKEKRKKTYMHRLAHKINQK